MSTLPTEGREVKHRETDRGGSGGAAALSRKQRWNLMRAVYPLNPGIPHFVDDGGN